MPIESFREEKYGIKPGTIVLFQGMLADIPQDWGLCDGNNGTPNLLDRMVKCVGSANTSPGATGGQHSYTLSTGQLPAHSHSGSTTTDGAHNHTYGDTTQIKDYDGWHTNAHDTRSEQTSTDGAHTHTASMNNTGSGNSIDNRPSYYELAYIMRL